VEGLRRKRGFALTEVLVVATILAVIGIPVMALIFTGSREGALSEDFMFAEALASRFIEEWGALPFAKLDDLVPRKVTVTGGDETLGPHKRKLESPQGFATELSIARVKEGLLSLEVTVSWQVPRERASRRFALFLFKAKPDIALEGAWPH
jgi:prepilin-type N-terminal cleavage/methylation domain-containing protein